jgi:hypothetical protein
MQGLLDDFWQRPLTDVGLVGPDQGKGGKYLLLPPGYTGETPSGYFVMKSPTYGAPTDIASEAGVMTGWTVLLIKGFTSFAKWPVIKPPNIQA